MADLKLGRLPKQGTVRVTIALPEPLKEELDAYASEYSRLYGPVETAALIPHMLEAFIRADRGWRSRRKQTEQMQTGQRRAQSNQWNYARRLGKLKLKLCDLLLVGNLWLRFPVLLANDSVMCEGTIHGAALQPSDTAPSC